MVETYPRACCHGGQRRGCCSASGIGTLLKEAGQSQPPTLKPVRPCIAHQHSGVVVDHCVCLRRALFMQDRQPRGGAPVHHATAARPSQLWQAEHRPGLSSDGSQHACGAHPGPCQGGQLPCAAADAVQASILYSLFPPSDCQLAFAARLCSTVRARAASMYMCFSIQACPVMQHILCAVGTEQNGGTCLCTLFGVNLQ